MRKLFLVICALSGIGIASAQTGDDVDLEGTFEMVRGFMAAERELMIEEELRLSNEEEQEFWPIYEDYRADTEVVQDRYAKLVADYAANYLDLSEDMADDMIDEYFGIQTAFLEIRQRYVRRFRTVLPAQKLARFIQIENKIDAVAQLPLMRDVPLTDVVGPVQRGRR